MASKNTPQEQEDALRQLEQLADCGELSVILAMLDANQIQSLAEDFNEGREDEHDGQPDEMQEWSDFDPDC